MNDNNNGGHSMGDNEHTEDDKEKWIVKVQRLLSKATAKGVSEQEADAFFGKAQELITKWGIEEAELAAAEAAAGKAYEPHIVSEEVILAGIYAKAIRPIWTIVAKHNNCTSYVDPNAYYDWNRTTKVKKSDIVYKVVGDEKDVQRVQMLATALQIFALSEGIKSRKEAIANGLPSKDGYYFQRSFIQGFAVRIDDRLEEAKTHAEEAVTNDTGMALVLMADVKHEAIVTHLATNGVELHIDKRPSNMRFEWSGALAGKDAAGRADLGQDRVGDRGTQKLLN